MDVAGQGAPDSSDPPLFNKESDSPSSLSEEPLDKFGPWIVVQHRKGRGSDKPSSAQLRPQSFPSGNVTGLSDSLHAIHVESTPSFSGLRGKGGKRGGRGSFVFGGRGARSGSGPPEPFNDPLLAPNRWSPPSAFDSAIPEEPLAPLALVPRPTNSVGSSLSPVIQSNPSIVMFPKLPIPLHLSTLCEASGFPSPSFPSSSSVPLPSRLDLFPGQRSPLPPPLLLTSADQSLPPIVILSLRLKPI